MLFQTYFKAFSTLDIILPSFMQPQAFDTTVLYEKIQYLLKGIKSSQEQKNREFLEALPETFVQFMRKRLIDLNELVIPIPRYIRVKPNSNVIQQDILKSLKLEPNQLIKIDDQFYAMSPDCKINPSSLYDEGLIYGMDYSSAIPARCLDVQAGHCVLELCSAPGNKSMYIADNVRQLKSITGIEININRAQIMKNLIKKYKLDDKIDVIVEDGLIFSPQKKYDRVLIDAECTHEGSIKHIKKFMLQESKLQKEQKQKQLKVQGKQKQLKNQIKAKKNNKNTKKQQQKQFQKNNSNHYTSEIAKINQWSVQDFEQRFLDPLKLKNLKDLQMGLLKNGFKLLKDNGILVYSTCSFDEGQNQQIIRQFLEGEKSAKLEDCRKQLKCACKYYDGTLDGTIHFSPSVSFCGGMFVSKISKIQAVTQKPASEQK